MIKRSISIYGHSTSIALEPEFWAHIDEGVTQSGLSFSSFIRELDDTRTIQNTALKREQNLASYLRVWVLIQLRESADAARGKTR